VSQSPLMLVGLPPGPGLGERMDVFTARWWQTANGLLLVRATGRLLIPLLRMGFELYRAIISSWKWNDAHREI